MRFSILSACAAVFMLSVGAQAATDCRAPYEPDVPAHFETKDQLMAVYAEVKDFITVKSPEFLECLDIMRKEVDSSADDSGAQLAVIDQRHNENVEAQGAVKNRFDAAYKIWKEENPEE